MRQIVKNVGSKLYKKIAKPVSAFILLILLLTTIYSPIKPTVAYAANGEPTVSASDWLTAIKDTFFTEEGRKDLKDEYNRYHDIDPNCTFYDPSTWGFCVGSSVAQAMLGVSAWVLSASARLFNTMIDYTLNIKTFINDVPIVYLGWSTFRDFANIIFIFIILYIAINTILGNEGYGIKKLLGKTIIAAMLINFSLFFTNIIIDTSNIFALQFYNQIVNTGSSSSDADGGISASFTKAMGLQDVFTNNATSYATSTTSSTQYSFWNILLVGVLGSVFILITSFVFLAATGMFLYRSLTLIFLMILSPLAFAGGILPKTQGYAGKWWDKLFNTAFFAPAYMAMLYLVASMVLGDFTSKHGTISFAKMILEGSSDTGPMIFNFVLLNTLMCACLVVASNMGAAGSKMAISWGKSIGSAATNTVVKTAGYAGRFAGSATVGLGAKTARGIVGGGSTWVADKWKNPTSAFGRTMKRGLRFVGDSSMDPRNIKVGGKEIGKTIGIGVGSTEGFKSRSEARQKAIVEQSKDLGAAGKRAFANSLKGKFSRRSSKKASEQIYKDALEEEIKKQSEFIQEIEDNPDIKRFNELNNKEKAGKLIAGTPEKAEYDSLKTRLENDSEFKFKYKEFDEAKGDWSKEKEEQYLDSTGARTRNILDIARVERSKAQSYKRNEKYKK